MSFKMPRKQYAQMYGPTTGDSIRLADTDLFIQIEKDYTTYGEEVVFGGGKVIRDGMGQHPLATREDGVPDVVITNAIILDYTGIVKADIAIRDGKIAGIGKAGDIHIVAAGTAAGFERRVAHILVARALKRHSKLTAIRTRSGADQGRVRGHAGDRPGHLDRRAFDICFFNDLGLVLLRRKGR